MNVLWISNVLFPEASALLTGEKAGLKTTGGWMIGAANELVKNTEISLTVASVSRRIRKLIRLQGEHITYFIIPGGIKGTKRINHGLDKYWNIINSETHPDVVHIHGTEFTHGLSYLDACGSQNVCVSIQGLVSVYYQYYYYGIKFSDILLSTTIKSILRGGIISGRNDFKRRSKSEIEIIRRVNHIIGRTQWDKSWAWAINPNALYHYGGETLRNEFYDSAKWSYSRCIPHSIFISQASYPIKGLHMLLRALPLVLRVFPDATVRVAGADLTQGKWCKRLFLSDYGLFIDKLIKKNNLKEVVTFTGPLNAIDMCNEYLHANVFVCPSSIENSPNSIGEAQLLGVPVIASYVGGVADMMKGSEEYLYRFEEIEMLANKIIHLFELEDEIQTESMKDFALMRHDPQKNIEELISIYKVIDG